MGKPNLVKKTRGGRDRSLGAWWCPDNLLQHEYFICEVTVSWHDKITEHTDRKDSAFQTNKTVYLENSVTGLQYRSYSTSIVKQQSVAIHTIRQTEIPALLDVLKTHLPSKGCTHKNWPSLHFRKKNNTLTYWSTINR